MSKRDDDSGADLEVGMTTAERRRRRRRGGGLRVPSDNVPRRTSPPVVAPVPEDPSLAMSIAYSFTSEAPGEAPSFLDPIAPENVSTVIDPVSGPVEQADFEMKTREMTAVDLEALGLSDSMSMPASRNSGEIPGLPGHGDAPRDLPGMGVEVRFKKPEPRPEPRPERAVRAEEPPVVERPDTSEELDVEMAEVSEVAEPRKPDRGKRERLKTVALSDEDLEEVREAVRASTFDTAPKVALPAPAPTPPPPRAHPPTPSPPIFSPAPRAHTPTPAPSAPLAQVSGTINVPAPTPPPRAERSAASEMWDEETPPPRVQVVASAAAPGPMVASSPAPAPLASVVVEAPVHVEPPPKPPAAAAKAAKADDSLSVPEIDINELADRASEDGPEGSGEFEVEVDEADEVKTAVSAPALPPAEPPKRERSPSVPPPIAPSASTTNPGVAPPPAPPPHAHAHHAPPPPPPAALHHHKSPPAPPQPAKKEPAPAAKPTTPPREGKPARGKPWFVDLFDEDYLRTLPFLTPQATQAEAEFVADAMGLTPGAQVLDVGCGYGRHAMELAARGFHVVGLDMSTPLLIRGGEEAQRRGLQINFVRGDMRELDFEAQFDGAYCLFSTFGYFDDETNKKTVANIARALKPGGRVLIEILNRDYVIADLPTRVWWEGDGCVVLEEVELNYFSSRIQVNRSVVFDDGRQLEQEISVRAYSLHEVGKLMHAAGFRVLEVSGGYQTRGRFFGNQSRHIIVLAERKEPVPTGTSGPGSS